jgi:tetratricopeptide (TPR) repeat protein
MRTLFLIPILFLMACSTQSGAVPQERMDLDPMLIRPGANGQPTEALDSNDVFSQAYTAFSARNYEVAAENYDLIIRYFPESRFYLPSLYNSGLAYEKLERWEEASDRYREVITKFPTESDARDAFYRLASAEEHLLRYEAVVELMTQVLLRPELTTFDRIEAHVRRANALVEIGNLDEAINGYQTALTINAEAPGEQKLQPGSHFLVQTYFGLGRVFHLQVSAIKLVLPTERMGEDLKEKADLFLRAQSAYIKALSFHHPHWSMAAGFMIGRLYEDFYSDVFEAEIPEDLSAEAVGFYFDELRKQIRPLMVRAVQVYEKNLSLSRRMGTSADDNTWVADTQKHLDRLKAYLDDATTQRRAERFVMRGRKLADMWAPVPVAMDVVELARGSASKVSKTP